MSLVKFSAALGAALVIGGPAYAGVTAINTPGAAYLSGTTLLGIGVDDFETVSSLDDGVLKIDFAPVEARTASVTWGPWGAAPDTEGDMPRVLYAAGINELTFSFSKALSVFGFEAQPDSFDIRKVSVDYYLNGVLQGSIGRDVDGFAGAKLLAAGGRFDKAVVRAADGFAVGQIRYELAPPVSPVPEAATWSLMIIGFGAAGTAIRLRRRAFAAA